MSSSPHNTPRLYERYGSGETGPGTGKRRIDRVKTPAQKTTSEEELALSPMDNRQSEAGVYTNCSADARSDESLELGLNETAKRSPKHIIVVTETSVQTTNGDR